MKKLLIILSTLCMALPSAGMEREDLQEITEERALQAALAASLASYEQEHQDNQVDYDEELAYQLAEIEAMEEREQARNKRAQEYQDSELARQLTQEQEKVQPIPASAPRMQNTQSTARTKRQAHKQARMKNRQPRTAARAIRRQATPVLRLPAQAQKAPAVQNRKFVYLPSLQQRLNHCGHHAAINAKVIQTLVEQGKEITAANIQTEARKYSHLIPKDKVTGEISEIILRYAGQLNINYLYFVKHDKATGFIPAGLAQHVNEDMDSFFKSIWVENKTGHFICNTGGHWILISIIKTADQATPHVIVLDSANPKQLGSTTIHMVNTLLKKLEL